MNASEIQRTRYVLRARFRRVQTSPFELFPTACAQLVQWIDNHPILSPISAYLQSEYEPISARVQRIITDTRAPISHYDPGHHKASHINEHAALCYFVVRAISEISTDDEDKQGFQLRCLAEFLTGKDRPKPEEALEILKDVALDGLFEYYDERIDTRNALYGLILKYKQLSEWFKRNDLRSLGEGLTGTGKGELALTHHLQEFLMSQGVEFMIEPTSASGEVDLILRDPDGTYLVIDSKYIKESASRSEIVDKLARGFHQVMKYCEDYNQPEGYLVAFSASPKRLSLDLKESDGTYFLSLGGKTIYYTTITIGMEPSASKLKAAEEVSITSDELKRFTDS